MDGFGDNFDQPEVDPAAEFLAREHDQLAGLEDELNSVAAPPPLDGILHILYERFYIWFGIIYQIPFKSVSDWAEIWGLELTVHIVRETVV